MASQIYKSNISYANFSNHEDDTPSMSFWIRAAAAMNQLNFVSILFLCAMGSFGNCLCMVIMNRGSNRNATPGIYFTAIAVADQLKVRHLYDKITPTY